LLWADAVEGLMILAACSQAFVWWRLLGRRYSVRRTVSWTGCRVDEYYRGGRLIGRTVHDFDSLGNPQLRHFDADGNVIPRHPAEPRG
jgi:hypothetical protein